MKKTFIKILILIFGSQLFAQEPSSQPIDSGNAKINENSSSVFGRWVYAPIFSPGISLLSIQKDATGNKIPISENSRFLVGLRAEKYIPNAARGYAYEFDYCSKTTTFSPNSDRYILSENLIGLSAGFNLKKGKYDTSFHPNIEFGLRNEIAINSSLTYFNEFQPANVNLGDLISTYRLWGYIGIGWKKDLFNQSGAMFKSNKSNAGLSAFQFRLYFPMFNQGNSFKDDGTDFPEALSVFKKNSAFNLFATVSYTQQLDNRKNLLSQYNVPPELINNKSDIFLPPLINQNISTKSIYGNFFLQYEAISPALDSVFAVINSDTTVFQNSRSILESGFFKFGYSLHFFGNQKKFVSTWGREILQEGIAWDLFLNGGIGMRRYQLNDNSPARLKYNVFEFSAGARVGYFPPGFYLVAGYGYGIPFNKQLLINDKTVENFNFSNIQPHIFYAGIGLRRNIYLIFNYYHNFENLKVKKSFFDRIGISIGFGI